MYCEDGPVTGRAEVLGLLQGQLEHQQDVLRQPIPARRRERALISANAKSTFACVALQFACVALFQLASKEGSKEARRARRAAWLCRGRAPCVRSARAVFAGTRGGWRCAALRCPIRTAWAPRSQACEALGVGVLWGGAAQRESVLPLWGPAWLFGLKRK